MRVEKNSRISYYKFCDGRKVNLTYHVAKQEEISEACQAAWTGVRHGSLLLQWIICIDFCRYCRHDGAALRRHLGQKLPIEELTLALSRQQTRSRPRTLKGVSRAPVPWGAVTPTGGRLGGRQSSNRGRQRATLVTRALCRLSFRLAT